MQGIISRAAQLLSEGKVQRVLGWKKGDLAYNTEPAFFSTKEELAEFEYNSFSVSNLSKFLIEAEKLDGTTLVFLKPCDTKSYNRLLADHRIKRDKSYIIGVGCRGNIDINKISKLGIKGIKAITEKDESLVIDTIYGERECEIKDVMLQRCMVCSDKEHKVYDEIIGESKDTCVLGRFDEVKKIEAMDADARFSFFQVELSRCIRCNACRNVCPACSCRKCVFDSTKFDSEQKANANSFEEKMFHIIRAFHVAGRCTDCGECSRVCPEGIPLHLLNRRLIKDLNELYGDFCAGESADAVSPLTTFEITDPEPEVR